MLGEEAGDVLVGLSVEQFGVLAVEVEVVLRTDGVALEHVHRALNELLHERLVGRYRAEHQALVSHQRKQQALDLSIITHAY